MKQITIKVIRKWFNDQQIQARHEPAGLKWAINEANEEFQCDAYDLFLLLVSNTPIDGLYTHSYGFHTANGRHIIRTMQNFYYEWESNQ